MDVLIWAVVSLFSLPIVWSALAERLVLSSEYIEHRTLFSRTVVSWSDVVQIVIDREGNGLLEYQHQPRVRGWFERIGMKPKKTRDLPLGQYIEDWRLSPVLDYISQFAPGIEIPGRLREQTPVPTVMQPGLIGVAHLIVLASLFLGLGTSRVELPIVVPDSAFVLWAGVWLGTLFAWLRYASPLARYSTRVVILGRGISLYLYPLTGAAVAILAGWIIESIVPTWGPRVEAAGIVKVMLGVGVLWPSLQDRLVRLICGVFGVSGH